jgi:hypothetical protein
MDIKEIELKWRTGSLSQDGDQWRALLNLRISCVIEQLLASQEFSFVELVS